ncbi:MAG: NifB/NifX family molybdenum-iron cluster-binding protein [Bryobacteraceae bacterium]
MRLAIPQHEGRISPVFDVAANLLLVDIENGREVLRRACLLSPADLAARLRELQGLGVDVLLCGAISAPLETLLVTSGIRVISFLCGPVDEVIQVFLNGGFPWPGFCMPGCGGPQERFRAGRRSKVSGASGMGFGRGGGGGRGRGAGRGFGGPGLGRPGAGGPAGECVCPKCGEKSAHTPGRPCRDTACPKCGTPMTRV